MAILSLQSTLTNSVPVNRWLYGVYLSYRCGQCTYSCLSSGKRGLNPVEMTFIKPRKEYWPSKGSNQRPLYLRCCMLRTELWGSAINCLEMMYCEWRKSAFRRKPLCIMIWNGPWTADFFSKSMVYMFCAK